MPNLHSRADERIDISGHLCVPVASSWDKAPEREGWEAFWVNVNLDPATNDGIQKVVKYRRTA